MDISPTLLNWNLWIAREIPSALTWIKYTQGKYEKTIYMTKYPPGKKPLTLYDSTRGHPPPELLTSCWYN